MDRGSFDVIKQSENYTGKKYTDSHYERIWTLSSPKEALESLQDQEELKNLMQLIWYQRLQESKSVDQSRGDGRNVTERLSKEKIKEEMKRGWPSFEPGVTNGRVFEYSYSEGDPKKHDLIKDIAFDITPALSETEIALLPKEYLYKILSDQNIDSDKLSELFELCSKDNVKIICLLIAIDRGMVSLEEIKPGFDFDGIVEKIKKSLPGFNSDL